MLCGFEEGKLIPHAAPSPKSPIADDNPYRSAKKQCCSVENENTKALREVVASFRMESIKERPHICFLCVSNPNLPFGERTSTLTIDAPISTKLIIE